MFNHGAMVLPKGAWTSTFGGEDGATFSASSQQCAFAFKHPEGNTEIVECDLIGLADVNGRLDAGTVIVRCPVCDDTMRLTMEDKPFVVGPPVVLRGPNGEPIRYRSLNVCTRVVCRNEGVALNNPNLRMACDWDVIIYKGVALDTPKAMAVMKATMDKVNGGLPLVQKAVARMRSSNVDGATVQQWDQAYVNLHGAATAAFARAMSGQYEPSGLNSIVGVWDTIDQCDGAIANMLRSLSGATPAQPGAGGAR